MFIDRAEHDLSSLSHSLKQSPEGVTEPMDVADASAQGPPVPPKPQVQQTFQQKMEVEQTTEEKTYVLHQQFQPQITELNVPLPGAVQVLPVQHAKTPPKAKPKPGAPPAFLSELRGAEISEGERLVDIRIIRRILLCVFTLYL